MRCCRVSVSLSSASQSIRLFKLWGTGMSTFNTPNSPMTDSSGSGQKTHQTQRVTARSADIGGGIKVNRLMPSRQRRMIGAWCFLDHAGPAVFVTGEGLRVGPHPHIGLQTFTWMIEGEVLHRDSLGCVQIVRPGQVNIMTAGHGIAHTEESLPGEDRLHAVQLWIALPAEHSECAPAFDHHPVLPQWREEGCEFTLLAGRYNDHVAPVKVYSSLLGLDLLSLEGAELELNLNPEFEYGVFVVQGEVTLGNEQFAVNELAYLGTGLDSVKLALPAACRVIVLGGTPFTEEIVLWWNFVAHSKNAIGQAHHDWEKADPRFGLVHGYDGERLSAPDLPWSTTAR